MSAFVIGIDTRINDGEDVEIVVPVLLTVDKIVLSDYCGYHYRIHGAQACAQKKEDAYFNVSCLYTWLYDKIKNSEYREALKPQIDQYMRFMVWEIRSVGIGRLNRCYFPFRKVREGANIILYGAGKLGRIYYWQVQKIPPEKIAAYQADYVFVAQYDETALRKVRTLLAGSGIGEDQIVYSDPW